MSNDISTVIRTLGAWTRFDPKGIARPCERFSPRFSFLSTLIITFMGLHVVLRAQTWDGGAGNGNWNAPNNWNPNGLPADAFATALIMDGNVQTNTTQNRAIPMHLNSLTFAAGAGNFTIGGDALKFGIADNVAPKMESNLVVQTHTVNVGITLNDDLTLTGANMFDLGEVRLDGVIGGSRAIIIENSRYSLRAANTYANGTRLLGGTLGVLVGTVIVNGNIQSGSVGKGTLTLEGGVVRNLSANVGWELANPIELDGDVGFESAGNAHLNLSGNVSMGGGDRTISCAGTGFTGFNGVISDNNNGFGIIKSGTGNLLLDGANTYGGLTKISGGRLIVEKNEALGTVNTGTEVEANGILAFYEGVNYAATEPVTLKGGTIEGYGDGVLGGVPLPKATFNGNITLTLDSVIGARNDVEFVTGGQIDKNGKQLHKRPMANSKVRTKGRVIGAGDVVVDGEGIVTMEGDNTYTGPTWVQSGTLELANTTGSGTSTGQVTVSYGARLSGSGTCAGTVIIEDGGILAPGNEIDRSLTVGNLELDPFSSLEIELGGASLPGVNYDQLEISGMVDLANALDVHVSFVNGFVPQQIGQQFTILTGQPVIGTVRNIVAPPGFVFADQYTSTSVRLVLIDAPNGPICGNGICENGENASNCPSDCGSGIPAVSAWGQIVMVLLLGVAVMILWRRGLLREHA